MQREIRLMARDWAARQYKLKALTDFSAPEELIYIENNWEAAMEEGKKLYQMVNSEKYEDIMKKRQDRREMYIHDGLDAQEIKRRERILERVAKQYIDAYAGDDLLVEENA